MNIAASLLLGLYFFFLSLAAHELGHKFKAEKLGYNAKINFFKKGELYTNITPEPTRYHQRLILINGVVWGLLMALFNVVVVDIFGVLFLMLYAWGCRDDLKQIRSLNKKGDS